MHRTHSSVLSFLLISATAIAQSTWTGAVSTAWNAPGNWTAGVPTSATPAVIAVTANQPSTVGVASAVCGALTINAGATVTTSTTFPLTAAGNISCAGVVGELRVNASASIATSGAGSIGNLTLATGNHTLTNVSMTGKLVQSPGSGVLTVQTCLVGGNIELRGTGLVGAASSLLDTQGFLQMLTTAPVTAPPTTIVVRTGWDSNSLWQPASGTVIFSGLGTTVTMAPGTVWRNVEAESVGGVTWVGDLRVAGTLRMRGDITVGGTVVDLTARAFLTFDSLLDGPSVTQLRIRNGLTSAGGIDLPNALLDADGDITCFLSAQIRVGNGTHTISNSFGMPGLFTAAPGASLLFDGVGVITSAAISQLPNSTITGTYTIREGHFGGNLVQAPGAGVLAIERGFVTGNCTFQGSGVVNSLNGFLDVDGNMTWQTTGVVNTPPQTIRCAGSWTANANFAPTSGTVVFDGVGPKTVTTPAFAWVNLRVEPQTQVNVNLPVLTAGFLDVAGTLATTGNDIESFGAVTISGVLQAPSSLRLRAHAGLDVSGQVIAGAARLDVDGGATIAGTASFGAGPHEVAGDLVVTGTFGLPPGQLLRLDGTGIVDVVASNPIPNVSCTAGDHDILSLVVGQDLQQLAGNLRVRSCVVLRDANLSGSGLVDLQTGLLNVRRHASVTESGAVTNPPATIRCGGNWTSSATFTPATGLVQFDGVGVQALTLPPTTWHDLRFTASSVATLAQNLLASGFVDVAGQLTVTGATIQVAGSLTVQGVGSLTAAAATAINLGGPLLVAGALSAGAAALAAGGDVTVPPAGSLALGAGPHVFQRNGDIQGVLLSPGSADFRFVGNGAVSVASTNVLPTVLFSGSQYKVSNLFVSGLIRHTAGRLTINRLVGQADALLQGQTIEGSPSDLLDVAGNLTLGTSSVVTDPPGTIRVGGNWLSNAQFLPNNGLVDMVGTGPQSMSTTGQLVLASLHVAGSSQVTMPPGDVIVQVDALVDGTLVAPTNKLEIRRDLAVGPGASLSMLAGVACTVSRSVTNSGSIGSGGVLRLIGVGSCSGGGSFADVEVDSTGEVTFLGNVTISGILSLLNGTLRLGPVATLHVLQDFRGTSGSLRGIPGGTLDVDGDVDMSGVAAHPTGVPDIRCNGDWTADGVFAPTGSTVFLDGTGSLVALGPLSFGHLEVFAGTRSLVGNANASALDVFVRPAARLVQGGNTLRLDAPTIEIQGQYEVAAGGTLLLGAGSAVHVASGGRIALIGTLTQLAAVDGPPIGGYGFVVDGTIEAMNFAFSRMGPQGVRINSAATIAAAPHDFRAGTFANGSPAPNSCLLHIDRSAATKLRYLVFQDAGTVTFNVRSGGTAQVGIVNDTGSFTGAAHEDDPSGRVDWLPQEHTAVTRFTASAAVHRTEIAFVTSAEVDVARFHLLRASAFIGPYIELPGSPFVGVGSPVLGGSYPATDFAVTDTSKYFYRLEEELTHGPRRVLGDDFARPWPQTIGDVYFVGTNGGYADIASAVAAAPVGGNVLVQAGTYPAFTLNKAVRIASDGSGPVRIDTSLGKFVVRDIPLGSPDVELFDLEVGTPTSGFGMEIVNCDNTIVVDGISVTTALGVTGLLVDDTAQVALQNCTISGDPGLRFQNAAVGYLTRGTVDELVLAGNSRVTRCGVVPGSSTVGIGSSVVVKTGTMPNLSCATTWASEKSKTIQITADNNSNFALFFSGGRDFFELSDVFSFLDMVLLIEQTGATLLSGGTTPAGTANVTMSAPVEPALWGFHFPIQVFELKTSGQARAGNSRSVMIVP